MKYFFEILLFLLISLHVNSANLLVGPQTTLLDGSVQANRVNPGDTIFMQAGQWDNIVIRNFTGSADKPLIFINKGGVVTFSTNYNFGISIQNCRYFRLTGTGVKSEFYGIRIEKVENGTGIGVGRLSSDFEIDHVLIKNVPIAGIYAKTDPDCSGTTTREKFVQYNTSIHDNYIESAGNEGLYIGNTTFFGQTVKCNGKDTLLIPSLLEGVKVFRNIIKSSGWDGIQVSSASKNCAVYENEIWYDSQAEVPNQMSGIILGGGSKCDCYNNLISNGKGIGIENHGLGGNRIFNNLIIDAGRNYFPGDFSASKMKYGIFISDVSTLNDSSYFILHNTIINPKSDGIRFSSVKSRGNLVASNVIINPGNFDYYENGNFPVKGIDSYLMLTNVNSDVRQLNNFFSHDFASAGLDETFKPKAGSPLVNAGYPGPPTILFDFSNSPRLPGNRPDIGAFEYQIPDGIEELANSKSNMIELFPNPADQSITVKFLNSASSDIEVEVFDLMGRKQIQKNCGILNPGWNSVRINVEPLTPGTYFLLVRSKGSGAATKFVKK
ncbi:MAG TPA: hypothetical protein DHV48_10845 [Prolixibacteraceae bacterium]|nr:hypothetical protein [Prolixibacteraceae bacterium]